MNKTIHKFAFGLNAQQTFRAHPFIQPLSVQLQHYHYSFWYETPIQDTPQICDDAIEMTIHCVGTGMPIPDNDKLEYISTVQAGDFVWHFYLERGLK